MSEAGIILIMKNIIMIDSKKILDKYCFIALIGLNAETNINSDSSCEHGALQLPNDGVW